jgi:heme oxygenase (biliverdin-producing, ferredoxin)
MSSLAPSPAPDTLLSARLKQATRELHTQAERSGVMLDLLRGRIGREAYLSMMRNLRAVYASLEAGLDQQPPSAFWHGLWRPELRRLPALDRDLAHWAGSGAGATGLTEALVQASQAYVARLQALAAQSPELLPAHAYVRYLGDLYGGQVLSRLVRQRFGLAEGQGTDFYEFGGQDKVEALRAEFRSALDAFPLTPQQSAAFVEEACEGFRLHRLLFEQVQALHPVL